MDRAVYTFDEITEELLPRCGGKGASLVRLRRLGLPVPEGWIVPAGVPAAAAAAALSALLPNTGTWAIRSSALNEDGAKASFAGAYETVTDVPAAEVPDALGRVLASERSRRAAAYAGALSAEAASMAVVVQRYVSPDFAGVVFTADPVGGSAAVMTGSFVKGAGERLVSGEENGLPFTMDAFRFRYNGPAELAPRARRLWRYCRRIRDAWGRPMDVEWAVSGGRLWLLQARPITTLRRLDRETYRVNGSLAGEYLLTRTNVGEIFMHPLSPATFSVMETICEKLGLPCFIDSVCGQAYMNLSVVCSALTALGVPRRAVFSKIRDLAGALPEGVEVPCFPFPRGLLLRRLASLLRPGSRERKKGSRGLADAGRVAEELRAVGDRAALRRFWDETFTPFMNASLGEIFRGVNVGPLFLTRSKLVKLCGEDLAGRLLTGAGGVLESMKPLLLLEDVLAGRLSEEEYVRLCGHRHADEMELSRPYPYEDPSFPADRLRAHRAAGTDMHAMLAARQEDFSAAKAEFLARYPGRAAWLARSLRAYGKACAGRERVRSDGVRIFCVLREYLRKAGTLTGLGEDIFLLYVDETLALLAGDESAVSHIPARQKSMKEYLVWPPFPNLILGRFVPEEWLSEPERRLDFYGPGSKVPEEGTIRGFPGAAGRVTGTVRVLREASLAEDLQPGEILVTAATNVGWTVVFPRAAAVVTDIGAPLSHAAIVAREFGIPAVVGCGCATTLLKTGDRVTVDGALGLVYRLSECAEDGDKAQP